MPFLRQGHIKITNWHALQPNKIAKKTVDKRGAKSNEAYVQERLGTMASKPSTPLSF